MLPSHPRRRGRTAFTTAVLAAPLGAVAGCAGTPSRQAARAFWSAPAAGTTPTATGFPWPSPSGAVDRLIADRLSTFIGSLPLSW